MGIEELSTFVEAVEQGSLAGAARALGVPRSTVSRRLARLEEELGQALIHRHSHLFKLTSAGELLHQRAAASVRALQRVHRFMITGGDELSGELHLTMPQDIGSTFGVVQILANFRREHPNIELNVNLQDSPVDLAASGFDVALRAHVGPLEGATTLKARKLGPLNIALYASPSYISHFGAPEHPLELATYECVAPSIAGLDKAWEFVELGSEARVSVTPKVGLYTSSMSFLLPAALTGIGIVPMVTIAARQEVETGKLIRVLPSWHIPLATLSLVWLETDLPSMRRRVLLDFMIEHLAVELDAR